MAGENLSNDGGQTNPNAIDATEYERRLGEVGAAHSFLYITKYLDYCKSRLRGNVPGMTAIDLTATSNESWIIGGALTDLLPEAWGVDKEALGQVVRYYTEPLSENISSNKYPHACR